MSLYDALSKISEQIKKQRRLMNNEANTIAVSINPFIRALGYDTSNLSEVRPEFPILNMDAVDFAIFRDSKPVIFIEAKRVGLSLGSKEWKQLFQYFNAEDVRIGILTNGIEYRFYTDLKKSNIMDEEPFLSLDMLKLDAQLVTFLEGFSKTRFDPERTVRKLKIFSLVEKETSAPSADFVKYFAKQIHNGPLFQKHISEYAPLVKQAWRDLVDKEIASRLQRHEEDKHPDARAGGDQNPDPAPVIKPEPTKPPKIDKRSAEIPIYGIFRKKYRAEATIVINESESKKSKVRFEGQLFTPSKAAQIFKLSIDSSITGATNGWTFWHLHTEGADSGRLIADLKDDPALLRRLLARG